MRALLQRTARARVTVADREVAAIGPGLTVFVCAMQDDDISAVQVLATKIASLRIFNDAAGKMNRSLIDTGGQCLLVSQFTLAADTAKGRRPSYVTAALPAVGKQLYECLAADLAQTGIKVSTGIFGATMQVELVNDGPVTIWLDSSCR